MRSPAAQAPLSGNFTWRDEFDAPVPGLDWLYLRVPKTPWADLRSRPGTLAIHPLAEGLDTLRNPSFLSRRQQHLVFEASTALDLPVAGVAAGLAALQSEHYWYFLGLRRAGNGMEVFLEKKGGDAPTRVVATRRVAAGAAPKLKIAGNAGAYSFAFDAGDGRGWQWLQRDDDGTIMSTDVSGGFIGAMLGPYARDERGGTR
ncbi:MAG: hypothetical protein EOP93_22630 [Lysobacteraceae bacterium]|nr:MAG: hypothetical protein EOP93_22630 [Xanthomonadaceae bacterium]